VLFTDAGFHVPVIPFEEVAGSAGTVPPEQIVKLFPKLNVGVTLGFTVTVNVAANAHCPAEGVKVYTSETVLLTVEGLQVPVMPLVEVPGKAGTVPPEHTLSAVPKLNAGVTLGVMVIFLVITFPHEPAVGVNV
jgi:hypothetical protein